MGSRADLPPPGSLRFITQPTQLPNNPNIKITSQHAEIWYNGELVRRIIGETVSGAELPSGIFIVNPLGNTLIEGQGPTDFSIAKTVCHALFPAGAYNSPVLNAARPPVWIKGSDQYGNWEQIYGSGINLINKEYADIGFVLDTFAGVANPMETLTAPAYGIPQFPVWVRFQFTNVNGFRFSLGGNTVLILQCPLLQVGAAVYSQYEWWIQMWQDWDLIEAYVIYPLTAIVAADRIVQTMYINTENVRFQSGERFDKLCVTQSAYSASEQRQREPRGGGRRRSTGEHVSLPFGTGGEEVSDR